MPPATQLPAEHPLAAGLLACSVRGCAEPLALRARSLCCARGHSFDLARGGWVNLLQPQDRRAREPGDSARSLDAREQAFAAGTARALYAALNARIDALGLPRGACVLEIGCGSGQGLLELARGRAWRAFGLDLSRAAIERAARRAPELGWLVANADRSWPLCAQSVALALSIDARADPRQLARVLARGGRALVVKPAAEDLAELRALVLGEARALEHAQRYLDSLPGAGLALARRELVRARLRVDGATAAALLAGSYRAQRNSQAERAAALGELEVGLAWDILELEPC